MMLAALAAATVVAAHGSPQAQAAAFYRACCLGAGRLGGVPDARGRARLATYLTPKLAFLLDSAARAEARHARAARGQEPPLLEGDVFSSLFEGPTEVRVESCRAGHVRAVCTARLVHRERGQPPVVWRDKLVLRVVAGHWRVDDVVYGGTWAFGNKGRLTQTLRAAVRDSD